MRIFDLMLHGTKPEPTLEDTINQWINSGDDLFVESNLVCTLQLPGPPIFGFLFDCRGSLFFNDIANTGLFRLSDVISVNFSARELSTYWLVGRSRIEADEGGYTVTTGHMVRNLEFTVKSRRVEVFLGEAEVPEVPPEWNPNNPSFSEYYRDQPWWDTEITLTQIYR